MNDTYVLDDAREAVYERSGEHGKPEDTFPRIADFWSDYLACDVDGADVAMMLALLKVAREVEGVYSEDNPTDIAGYAEGYARLKEEDE